MKHIHSVYDTDSHFSISPITRAIKNESSKKTTVMQYDHNSERFTFEMPREIEGHDMTLCNRVEVHYINTASNKSGESKNFYVVDDLQTSPEDDTIVICSWLISQNATMFAGSLAFLLRFVCLSEEGEVTYSWNTDVFKGISVSSGIFNNSEEVIEPYPDALAHFDAKIADLQSQIDLHHPVAPIAEYISMMPYLESKDIDNVNLLLSKGEKFHICGSYRMADGEMGEWDTNIDIDTLDGLEFEFDFIPDKPMALGTLVNGNVSNFKVTGMPDSSWQVSESTTVTRASMAVSMIEDEWSGFVSSIYVNMNLHLIFTDNETWSNFADFSNCSMWYEYYNDEGYCGDGRLSYVESYIEKTNETSHFFPSTMDFRTQSIDRRLTAALEEAIEKRRAERESKEE